MPSLVDHKRQAEKNEEVATSLEGAYPDWSVTAYFYAALHLTRAWLREHGYPPRDYQSHLDAEEALNEAGFGVIDDYKQLKSYSRTARYECPKECEMLRVLPIAKEIYKEIKKYVSATMSV